MPTWQAGSIPHLEILTVAEKFLRPGFEASMSVLNRRTANNRYVKMDEIRKSGLAILVATSGKFPKLSAEQRPNDASEVGLSRTLLGHRQHGVTEQS